MHLSICQCTKCVLRRGDERYERFVAETAPKYVEAVEWRGEVHAAEIPGNTGYRTACQRYIDLLFAKRAEVMSVDYPDCLQVLAERRFAAAKVR